MGRINLCETHWLRCTGARELKETEKNEIRRAGGCFAILVDGTI